MPFGLLLVLVAPTTSVAQAIGKITYQKKSSIAAAAWVILCLHGCWTAAAWVIVQPGP
jgi:hypothetical protein